MLASGGLVILSPNRGASVARISPQEIDELFPIMGALEALAGELAARASRRRHRRRSAECTTRWSAITRSGEAAPYLKLNRAIHEAIFAAAGNAELTQLYHTVMVRTHAVRFTAKKSPARWDEAVEDHVQIMAALEARDGPRLGLLLKEHLRHKAGMVHESLADTPGAAAG